MRNCLVTLLIYKVLKPGKSLDFLIVELSYFTDLQGSQTKAPKVCWMSTLSYFTDLQGSQTVKITVYTCK